MDQQPNGRWLPTGATYEESTVDWARLNRYAQRVARETSVVPEAPVGRTVTTRVPRTVERHTKGLLGFGRRTFSEVQEVETTAEETVVGEHWPLHK
ncbi:hypothetical protein [Nocardioides kribbensis]|uniref:Uncharacterized protein n=1 Tax=Nocardioides kribbensis TaxID=305517 RepID=A0ABV1NTD9_9ACTN